MYPTRQLTHQATLQENLNLLASVEANDAPFISCCLDLSQGLNAARDYITDRLQALQQGLAPAQQVDLMDAGDKALRLLQGELPHNANSALIYTRGKAGGEFDLLMPFAATMDNALRFYPAPDLYPAISLLNGADRFLLILLRSRWMQVLEVDLGAASAKSWTALPGTQAQRWGSASFTRPGQGLDYLLQTDTSSPLILAGDVQQIAQFRTAMPRKLAQRLVETVPLPLQESTDEAVAAALSVFRLHRQNQHAAEVSCLIHGLRSHGPALGGGLAAYEAIDRGEVELLIMDHDYRPKALPICQACLTAGGPARLLAECGNCAESDKHPMDLRLELLRLATQRQVPVALVSSAELSHLGGVGCLLQPDKQMQTRPLPKVVEELRLVA